MTLGTTTPLSWQAKIAFACTALFSLTSISINAVYGFGRGDGFASSLIWAVLAIAVGATLLLSTAALFRSLAARAWTQAAFIVVGLLLCGSYSLIAAIGSATGQRVSAGLAEDATSTARSEAQKALEAATSHAAGLATAKPSASIQSEIDGILLDPRLEKCASINGPRTRETCPHVADLRTELAKAQAVEKDRTDTQAAIDKARAALSSLPPPRASNSDAKAMVQLLQTLGFNPTVAQVNTMLAILSVLVVELGGSASLAVGMALSGPVKGFDKPSKSSLSGNSTKDLSASTVLQSENASDDGQLKPPKELVLQPPIRPAISVRDRLLADVRNSTGGVRATYDTLAAQYGVSGARIGQVVRLLKQEGVIRVRKTKSGTVLTPALGLAVVN